MIHGLLLSRLQYPLGMGVMLALLLSRLEYFLSVERNMPVVRHMIRITRHYVKSCVVLVKVVTP